MEKRHRKSKPKQDDALWVLRVWHEPDSGEWRAMLKNAATNQQFVFNSQPGLQAFLLSTVLTAPLTQ